MTPDKARLDFRLLPDQKKIITQAAAQLGQTVTDFAVSTLVQAAREVLRENGATHLSQRDHDTFLALLDDRAAEPNKALIEAAERYKDTIG